MSDQFMKLILNLLLVLFLSACATVEISETPIVINTEVIPTSPTVPPTSTPTPVPATEIPCDAFSAEFCITEGHFILQRPIHLPANDLVDETYLYGSTANGTREPHHGVEFPNKSGTPVYAVANGIVVYASPDTAALYSPWPNFYGNLVVIQHKDNLFTLYAHLSKINVEVGGVVGAGTKIGEVGRTGVAIGSHLHFEVRSGDVRNYFATENPELWLIPAKDGNGQPFAALTVSVLDEDGELVKYAEYTIRYSPRQSPKQVKSYYGITYSADMLRGKENLVLGELSAGRYRIAIERNGKVYERWVEVESGKLTQVVFVVK
jgi:murein DD-endopeptidase MepM/ murein hydrolase activator NlpD